MLDFWKALAHDALIPHLTSHFASESFRGHKVEEEEGSEESVMKGDDMVCNYMLLSLPKYNQ